MDAAVVREICRLCPNKTQLKSIFDEPFSGNINIKEAIFIVTGIEVLENDEISVKICNRCLKITTAMVKYRKDANRQDKFLRRKCNTDARIKKVLPSTSSAKKTKRDLDVHKSIAQISNLFPTLKLPSICKKQDMAAFITLPLGEVEKYFKDRKLNMNQYIWKSPAPHDKSTETSRAFLTFKPSATSTPKSRSIILLSDDDNNINAYPSSGSPTAPEIISSVNTSSDPITEPVLPINYGPFNIAYNFDKSPETNDKSGAWDWDSLPPVNVGKKSSKIEPVVTDSKPVASSSVPIQLPAILENNNPQPSSSRSNDTQAVNSQTPMLQALFDRVPHAAVPRKPLRIRKSYSV
ncbi:unnamed protein product [Ceutorhynchus assimilis]|uniref:ZAD domain-containing protein n=1 Tax=Ceutorhynchus assimilis TaxID=467358 RepID=A0A9N9MGE1_9CUCU|nr:unnamed protein product [Ceutorhynchus assimilis]